MTKKKSTKSATPELKLNFTGNLVVIVELGDGFGPISFESSGDIELVTNVVRLMMGNEGLGDAKVQSPLQASVLKGLIEELKR